VSGSGISWAACKSASRSRQITTTAPHHSVFLEAGCPSCCQTNSVKASVPAFQPIIQCNKHKSAFSFICQLTTLHCLHLLLSTVLWPHAAAPPLLGTWWPPLSIDISYPHGAQQQTRCRPRLRLYDGTKKDGQRQKDTGPLHRPCSARYAGSVNKYNTEWLRSLHLQGHLHRQLAN